MKSRTTLPPMDVVAVLVVTLLWGGNIIAIKLATTSLPPFLSTALRFGAVALVLCPFYRPAPGTLRHIWPVAAIMGIGHFGLLFLGLSGVDSATGAVVTQLGVPFSVILSWLVLGDHLTPRRIAGLVLAFSGVVVLAGAPNHPDLPSMLIVVFSDLMWAAAMMLIKRSPPIPPMVFNGWTACIAAPLLGAVSFMAERDQWQALRSAPLEAWGGVAYTVVGASLVAYTLWYNLLRAHPLSRVVPYTLLSPVVAFTIGAAYLGEIITPIKILGGLLTVLGVAIIEIRGAVPSGIEEQT